MNLIVSLVTILLLFLAEPTTSQGIYTKHGCRADLCFIVDKSASVGQDNWDLTVEFMLDFVEKLPVSLQATKVGVVTFDEWGYFDQPLSGNKTHLEDAISNLVYDGFGTAIHNGLYAARTECFTTANGDRDDANNIAVLITDGDSNFYNADQEALNLRATGATIIAVGVGTGVNLDLLEAVANGLDNVFLVADFTALLTDTSLILGRSCSFAEACLANLDSSDDYPSLTDCPQLSNPLVDGYEFYFTCFINHTSDSEAKYKVTFLSDGETSLYQETLTETEDSVRLNQSYLQGHMGKYVSCRVETYWESSPGIVSAAVSSRSYWIGITFSKRVVAVYETDDNPDTEYDNAALMHTFSTVPVLCPWGDDRTCYLGLSIRTTGSIAVFQQKENEIRKCFAMIFRHDWKPEDSLAYNANRPIQVMAKRLWVPSLIRKGSISMTTEPHQYSHPDGKTYSPWDNYQPVDIPVLVHGGNKRCLCTSTGDPHITTCDGLYYHGMDQGIFILLDHKDVKVQVKHCPCPSTPNCAYNCGVAVRQKGFRPLIIDRSTGVVKLLKCQSRKEWSITANDARNVYTIDTMYGVRVTVILWTLSAMPGLNVHVNIPSSAFSEEDQPNVGGLCGNFNGDIDDEFYLPGKNEEKDESIFENHWKITEPGADYFTCESPAEEETEFCQCEGMEDQEKYGESPGIICGLSSPLLTNSWTNNQLRLLLPGFLKNNDLQGNRKRRSTDDNYQDDYAHINRKILSTDDNIANDIDEYDFDYQVPDSSFYEPAVGDDTPPAWGTLNISEAEAENTCRGVLSNSDAVTVCQNYVADSLMDIIVDKCKDDIRRTGNESFASPYISEYQAYCIHNFLNEANVTDPDNPMDDPVFSQVYNSMMNMMCTNNCSNNGICELGSCVCESGYIGADCSLPVGTQPTVTQYKGPPECDIRDRPCRMVQVQAENMTNSNISCQIHVQMANGSGETYTYGGELYTADVIFCPLPDPTSILTRSNSHLFTVSVSLSNDGEIFSDTPPVQHISVFDSDQVWAACSQNGIYESKSETCYIEGQCYQSGDKNGSCQVCDPTIDGQDWTVKVGCVPGSEDLSTTTEGYDIALESTLTQSHESTVDVKPASSTDSPPASSSETTTSSTDSLPASSSETTTYSTDSHPVSSSETTTSSTDSHPASSSETTTSSTDSHPASSSETITSSTDSHPASSSETTTSSTDSLPASSSVTPTLASQQMTKLTNSTQQGIPTRVTNTPDSKLCYGSWTELSVCSKSCDYGIKSRTRDCLCDTCTRILRENELCNEINCEELDTNGAGLRISFGGVTMIKYVAKENEILTVALDLLNEYSKTHVTDLCHSVGLDVLSEEVVIEMIFDSDNIQVAQGYPRLDPENNDVILTKIIVEVTLVELSGVCQLSSNKRKRRAINKRKRRAMNSERIPVDSLYLTQALADLDTELTKMMGDGTVITIGYQEVSQPTTKTTDTKLIKIVVPVVIIALVIIVVAALVSTKMLKKRSIIGANPDMENNDEVENPPQRVKSDEKAERLGIPQMDVSEHLQPDDPDAKQGIEQIPDNPTVRGPTPLERELTQSEIEIKGAWQTLK